MDTGEIISLIKSTESPLKRQLLLVGLISRLLEDSGKGVPILIGGCALSYYSREVYFTSDVDLAYSDREALDEALRGIGFSRDGRYWVNNDLKLVVEVPAGVLVNQDAPLELVEMAPGLSCRIIGLEDLVIDRLNACKYWKSEIDCEMLELLLARYAEEMDWQYLEQKASDPGNKTLPELNELRGKTGK